MENLDVGTTEMWGIMMVVIEDALLINELDLQLYDRH